jgi:transcriptional regulator with XRE-family HTH domain
MTPTEFRSARKALGLTQDQVARVLGVSPPTIRKWEAGPNCSTSTKVNGAAAVYMAALLDGWRPSDWAEATAKPPRKKRAVKACV